MSSRGAGGMRMKMKKRASVAAILAIVAGVVFLLTRSSEVKVPEAESSVVVPAVTASAQPVVPSPVPPAAVFELPTNQTLSVRGTKPYVLSSEVRFQTSLRRAAEALGARTVGALSAHRLLIEATPAVRARLAADGRFSSVDEYLPTSKLAPRLLKALKAGQNFVEVALVTLSDEDRLPTIARVTAAGGEILTGCLNCRNSFRARLSAAQVVDLAGRGEVRWMEPFVRPQIMNDLAAEPAAMNLRSVRETHGFTGAGQYVSTSDTGVDLEHLDLKDQVVGHRVVAGCSETDVNGHGTHTAGSIAGTGAMSASRVEGAIRGAGYGAKLWAWFCGVGDRGILTPGRPEDLFRPDQEHYPTFIHSASWGSTCPGEYTDSCAKYDQFVWENADFLPVFSAGNEGDRQNTIGSPASAKNVLTVGATQNVRQGTFGSSGLPSGEPEKTAGYSSRGPCADGRIKPDLATPGSGVLSTRSHGVSYSYGIYDEYYAYDCGTSMACPLAAGAVAVVREWLMSSEGGGFTEDLPPTSALMKAIVTGGAKDAPTPNMDQGWGRMDVAETLFPDQARAVKLVDRIPFEEGQEFYYVVETTNAAPLDVQLAWVDYPADVGEQKSPRLVNDLDLTVESLDGATFAYGNGGLEPDTLNNVESVRFASVPTSRYLITVTCSSVLYDHTEGGAAALYIRGAFDPKAPEPQIAGRVRIRERPDELYMSLDKALREVQAGETVEVLAPVTLQTPTRLPANCTIVATNSNPLASKVAFSSRAELIVTDGVTLSLSNIALDKGGARTVDVQIGGQLRIGGFADLSEVRVADKNGLVLERAITAPTVVDAPFAPTNGVPFATCASPDAGATAGCLLNKYDDESLGEAKNDLSIWWAVHPEVPLAAASVRYEAEGEAPVGYRSLSALIKHHAAPTGSVAILRNTTVTNCPAVVDFDLFLYGASAGVSVTPNANARFTIAEGGSLTISNLTVSGYVGARLFHVVGGEMTLAKGAVLSDLVRGGREYKTIEGDAAFGGATALESGVFTMLPGAKIINCTALGDGSHGDHGGGLYACGGTLNLLGGEISGCEAPFGAGVYANMLYGDLDVNLTGDLKIVENWRIEEHGLSPDNLCILTTDEMEFLPIVSAEMSAEASVGVNYDGDGTMGVDVGERFATVDAAVGQTTEDFMRIFSNDVYLDLRAELVEEDGEKFLQWAGVPDDGQVDPSRAWALAIYGEGTADAVTNYYPSVGTAFKNLTNDATVVVLFDDQLGRDVNVEKYDVVLRSSDGEDARTLRRYGDISINVKAGAFLTVRNLTFDGSSLECASPLMYVTGGALTLEDGATIRDVVGIGNNSDAAVYVTERGTVTMRNGSLIENCVNKYDGEVAPDVPKDGEAGLAGGIVLIGGTAYLRGGEIRDCASNKGGAVFIGNDSTNFVSGTFAVTHGNTRRKDGQLADFTFDGNGIICLDGEYMGRAGVNRGWNVGLKVNGEETLVTADTNVFGFVEGDVEALADSAHRFYCDTDLAAYGLIATNDVRKILVWSTAVVDGKFVGEDGSVYGVVGGSEPPPPPPPPPVWTVVTNHPSPIAFKSIDRVSDTEWALVVTNRERYCNYRLIWTTDLGQGFVSTGDWEHVVHEDCAVWATNVITTGGAWFWRAEGADGTNMVPPQVEN